MIRGLFRPPFILGMNLMFSEVCGYVKYIGSRAN